MVTESTFLDLQDLLINEIAGSEWLFVFLALGVIFFVAAYFKMNNGVTIMLALVFCVFMWFWFPLLGILAGLVIGIMFGVKFLARMLAARI